MKNIIRDYFKLDSKWYEILLSILLAIIIGALLLVLSCLVPNNKIQKHIEEYADEVTADELEYYGGDQFANAVFISNDVLLLEFLYNRPMDNLFYSAFVYRQPVLTDTDHFTQKATLIAAINREYERQAEYGCYWMGLFSIIRPLLHCFSWPTVVHIFEILSLILALVTLVLIAKRLNIQFAVIMFASLCFTNFTVLSKDIFQGLICFDIMFVAINMLLISKGRKNQYAVLFAVLGSVVAYFDFISVPLVVWAGSVLAIYYMLDSFDTKRFFNILWNCSIGWILGYGGMIIAKILIVLPVMGKTSWMYMLSRIRLETGNGMSLATFLKQVLIMVYQIFPCYKLPVSIAAIFMVIYAIVFGWSFLHMCAKERKYILLGLIGLSPLVWYIVFKGHIHHAWVDYRMMFISVMATLIIIVDNIKCLVSRQK